VLHDLRQLGAHAGRWTPRQGPLARWIAAWTPDGSPPAGWTPDPALDAIVRAAVPPGLDAPPALAAIPAPAWEPSSALVRRYLAARLVACWPLHYGTGLATASAYVAALLTVIAGGLARRSPTRVDDAAVRAAIGDADRLVVHLAAPDALARGLDAWAAAAGDAL
jgi:hypothetical protein